MVETRKQLIAKYDSIFAVVNTKKSRSKRKRHNYEDYISKIPDDLLIQIFTCLTSVQCLSQCSRVCKRWFSLVNLHRQNLYSSYQTILFNFSPENCPLNRPFLELFPECLRIEECILDFLPGWPNLETKASCNDLLLVSRSIEDYFVCNPLTREWIALPKAPPPPNSYRSCGYGLTSDPHKSIHNYRAVVLHKTNFFRDLGYSTFNIFCSETGRWTELIFEIVQLPFRIEEPQRRLGVRPLLDLVVTHNGALYWLDGTESIYVGIISFHPYTKTLRYIEFPPSAKNWVLGLVCHSKYALQLGVVRGRLRLSMVRHVSQVCVDLEIWELDDDDSSSSWVLVHKVLIDKMVFVLALHPNDTNVVFVVWGHEILRLCLGENEYDKVGEIPSQCHPNVLAACLKFFPLKHYSLFPSRVLRAAFSQANGLFEV